MSSRHNGLSDQDHRAQHVREWNELTSRMINGRRIRPLLERSSLSIQPFLHAGSQNFRELPQEIPLIQRLQGSQSYAGYEQHETLIESTQGIVVDGEPLVSETSDRADHTEKPEKAGRQKHVRFYVRLGLLHRLLWMMNVDELRHVIPFVTVKTLGGQRCYYNHPDLYRKE